MKYTSMPLEDEKLLTIPNATPLKAVWNSKLGVGSSGVG